MKIEPSKDPRYAMHNEYTPETPAEKAALDWVKEHAPIFAAAESYGVEAFLAGVKWALVNEAQASLKPVTERGTAE